MDFQQSAACKKTLFHRYAYLVCATLIIYIFFSNIFLSVTEITVDINQAFEFLHIRINLLLGGIRNRDAKTRNIFHHFTERRTRKVEGGNIVRKKWIKLFDYKFVIRFFFSLSVSFKFETDGVNFSLRVIHYRVLRLSRCAKKYLHFPEQGQIRETSL